MLALLSNFFGLKYLMKKVWEDGGSVSGETLDKFGLNRFGLYVGINSCMVCIVLNGSPSVVRPEESPLYVPYSPPLKIATVHVHVLHFPSIYIHKSNAIKARYTARVH